MTSTLHCIPTSSNSKPPTKEYPEAYRHSSAFFFSSKAINCKARLYDLARSDARDYVGLGGLCYVTVRGSWRDANQWEPGWSRSSLRYIDVNWVQLVRDPQELKEAIEALEEKTGVPVKAPVKVDIDEEDIEETPESDEEMEERVPDEEEEPASGPKDRPRPSPLPRSPRGSDKGSPKRRSPASEEREANARRKKKKNNNGQGSPIISRESKTNLETELRNTRQ